MMANSFIPIGVKIIGYLSIFYGSLMSLIGIFLAIFVAIYPNPFSWLFTLLQMIPGLIFLIFGIISIIVGAAFLKGSNIARIIIIILSILDLFFFPIGTIVGTILLLYLFSPGVVSYFKEYRRMQE
jgi:hypothetical protein